MASSSSSSTPVRKYDVFLSFRGEDTRRTIVSNLYEALRRDGIFTFRDDRRLQIGDNISSQLIEAIQTSWFAVVVISENYATSKWCLEELRLIMELHGANQIRVVPIFYGVEPCDVRHLRGSFETAFQKYEDQGTSTKRVSEWKRALNHVSNLSGFHSRTSLDEAEMISNAVQSISRQLLELRQPSGVGLVGMEAHMMKMHFLTNMWSENEVLRIGIWGMGGVGKTTIAKCLYDCISRQFSAHYFIEDIKKMKDKSPSYLQEEFLFRILRQHTRFISDEAGPEEIKARLGHQKVLLVLDGVDKVEQIHALAKETSWFGSGSRIIITTRDRGLLNSCGVDNVHEVKCLGNKDALQVFKKLAFGGRPPPSDGFEQLFIRASQLAHGLPSALVAYASYLSENTTIERWEDELRLLEIRLHENVEEILRTSYDSLNKQDKAACLHVACFFNGYPVSHVASLLDDGRPRINHLTNKSLISISADGCINMHFLVVQTGREIVRQESRDRPHKQRFLWDPEKIYDILNRNIGTDKTEGVTLHMCEITHQLPLSTTVFDVMHNIKYLKFFQHSRDVKSNVHIGKDGLNIPPNLRLLHWDSCPLQTLSSFRQRHLVQVELRYSNLERFWDGSMNLQRLRRLDVTGCKNLIKLPDFSTATNLEELIVEGCTRLRKMPPESLMSLFRLTKLNAIGCNIFRGVTVRLRERSMDRSVSWPTGLEFTGSEEVLFNVLTDLSIEGKMCIDKLGFWGNAEYFSFGSKQQIPEEMMRMKQEIARLFPVEPSKSLEIMQFSYVKDRKPFGCYSFRNFPYLTELKLININIPTIPEDIYGLTSLERLDLSGNDFIRLPFDRRCLPKLKYLRLQNCRKLRELQKFASVETLILSDCVNLCEIRVQSFMEGYLFMSQNVQETPEEYCFNEIWLDNCKNVVSLSQQLRRFTNLTYLDLSRNNFVSLPETIRDLSSLGTLFLDNCKKLRSVEELPQSIRHLYAHGCDSLVKVSLPPNHSIVHVDLSHCPRLNRDEHNHLMDLFQKGSRKCSCFPGTPVSGGKIFRSIKSVFTKGVS